jgi:large subunit ribosomal protein L16
MLQPSNVKWRKSQRGRRKGKSSNNTEVILGDFGLKAMQAAWITARQIEAARIAITRNLKRGGQVWIRIFPAKPVSKKPAEVRQGGGKAAVEFWVAVVKRGQVLFEVGGVDKEDAKESMRLASHKLPIPTKTVKRDRFDIL